jgi:DNA-binding transcriptional MerR regulator
VNAPLVYSIGDVARLHGVPIWAVRRLYQRKILPEPGRVGVYRVVTSKDLPAIEKALRACGYLRTETVVA